MSEVDPELVKAIDSRFDSLSLLIGKQKYGLFMDSIIKEFSTFEEIPTPLELKNKTDKVIYNLVINGDFNYHDVNLYIEWGKQTLIASRFEIESFDSSPDIKEKLLLNIRYGNKVLKKAINTLKQHEVSKEGNDTKLTKLSQSLYDCGFIAKPLSFAQAIQNTGKCDWQKDIRLLGYLLFRMNLGYQYESSHYKHLISNQFLIKGEAKPPKKVYDTISNMKIRYQDLKHLSHDQQVIFDMTACYQ